MRHIFPNLWPLLPSPMLCHVSLDIYEGISWGGRTCLERRPVLFPFQCAPSFVFLCRKSEFCGPRCRKSSAPPTVPLPFLSTTHHRKIHQYWLPMRSSSRKNLLGAALSPGAETTELRQWRTDENNHVCRRPMNGAKIRNFRHETFHEYLLSSQVCDAIVRNPEHCWGSRTRHWFTLGSACCSSRTKKCL